MSAQAQPTKKRGRPRKDLSPVKESPAKRFKPTPAPRRRLVTRPPPPTEPSDDEEPIMADSLRRMDEANQARCEQIAAEGRQERDSMRASIAALSALIRESMSRSVPEQPSLVVTPPTPVPVTPVSNTKQADPQPSTSTHTDTATSSETAVTPERLQQSDEPVKSLRRDQSTSSLARGILQEIGLIATGERDRKRRRRGNNGKHREAPEGADWPEDYVYRLDGSEPSYDTLTLPEFAAAMISIMEELTPVLPATEKVIRMFHYYRGLMEDCFEDDWSVARTAHKQVLQGLEHKRIVWSDAVSCIDTKRNAIQRAQRRNVEPPAQPQPTASPLVPVHPCPDYQVLSCTSQADHWVNGRLHTHCCAWCYRTHGQRYPHPEELCRRKFDKGQGKSKNSRGRGRRPNQE